jgi:hypothetical protein
MFLRPNKVRVSSFILLVGAIVALGGTRAQGALTVTPAGQAQGLSLTTFASGFPNTSSVGPLGIAFPTTGGVLVSDYPGNIRLFPTDTDGQNAASVPPTQSYGQANAHGMAQVNGIIYMAQQGNSDVVQVNNNGTFNQTIVTGIPGADGMAANPFTGHFFVSAPNNSTIYDVNPIAKTATPFVTGFTTDGLSLSPDGSTLYAAVNNGHILGFNTTTKTQVYDSGSIAGGVDGTAVGTGLFTGLLFVNTNGGTVVEVTLTGTPVQTLIATGGSRGDFVTVDPSTNTLLITQTDSIIRLSGASFTVPEPASFSLLGIGLVALLGAISYRRLWPGRLDS